MSVKDASCFVTGTDTGVGKTLVASALIHAMVRRFGPHGVRVAGMKPVAAGASFDEGVWRNDDVEQLLAAVNVKLARDAVCPYLLSEAIAPHIAAELAGVRIERQRIVDAFEGLRAQADIVIVEGVGGFRVPLAPGFDTADLAVALGLPVVLVVGVRLGCLNHAALTAEAIAARGLRLVGWVASAIDPNMEQAPRNLTALQDILNLPCLGRIPYLEDSRAGTAADYLDLSPLIGAADPAGL
jgi:dethiobiotin synthetase